MKRIIRLLISSRTYYFGILAGSTILLKQSTGLILAVTFAGYKILEIRKKEDIKSYLKILGTRLIGILIPLLVFAIYLTYNNIWTEFIDYAITGIKTFSNTVPYGKLLDGGRYEVLAYIMPLSLVTFITISIFTLTQKNIRDKTWSKNLRIFLVYDLAAFCIIYPISDKNHFAIGTICIILTIVYLLYEAITYFLKVKNKDKLKFILKTFVEAVSVLSFLGYMGISLLFMTNYIIKIKDQEYLNHFKYITTNEGLKNRIDVVDKYILGKKSEGKTVYMLDSMAAVYMIPTSEYNKDYDMFNVGNFGAKGEKRNNRRFEDKR